MFLPLQIYTFMYTFIYHFGVAVHVCVSVEPANRFKGPRKRREKATEMIDSEL